MNCLQVMIFDSPYVFVDVLPTLACLSKTFQEGKFNFSQIKPSKLNPLVGDSTPVVKLENEIEKAKYDEISKNFKPTDGKLQKAYQLLSKNVNSLIPNIDKCFSDCLGVVNTFDIFDPLDEIDSTDPDFKEYGTSEIDVLANHFYPNDQLKATKLHAEGNQFK